MTTQILDELAVTRLMTSLDQALETYRTGIKGLTRDGRRLYADDEHERRVKQLRRDLETAFRETQDKLEASLSAAEQALTELQPDPLLLLSAADLARASALRAFIEDDITRRPQQEVAQQARLALERGDRAAMALYARAIGRLVADAQRGGRAFHPDLGRVLSNLEGAFVDQKKWDKLVAGRDAARAALGELATRQYLLRSYGTGALRAPAA